MGARRTYPCLRLSIFMPLGWLALLVGAPQVLAPPSPFACGYMVSGDVADFPASEHGERVWTAGRALLAAALLGLSARLMPN